MMRMLLRIALVASLVLVVAMPGGCRSGDTETANFLPASGEIAGWEADGAMLRYEPDNLWEYIDGAAENFLAYEFEEVVVRDYRDDNDRGLKVEIYRLGSPLMAFGVYSRFRGPDLHFVSIGAEGFIDPYSLHFWKGACYVKVAVFEESAELADAMERFAGAVAAKIPGESAFPPEVDCFPTAGLIDRSVTYITEGVLGSAAFPPSFAGSYRIGGERGTLYLSPAGDGAREVFAWYAASIDAGREERDTPHGAVTTAVGNDRYRGETVAFLYDGWLGVFTGFGGHTEAREALISAAIERISRLKE